MMKKDKKDTCLTVQYFLNHKLDLEEIKKHIIEFAEKGYQGIFAHARQGLLTPYMSDEWWKVINKIVCLCKELGVEFWIWDEDYFPSGLAGGRIAWEFPELTAGNLNFKVQVFENEEEIELDFLEGYLLKAYALELNSKNECEEIIDISDFCGTRRNRWTEREVKHSMYSPLLIKAGNPHWRCAFVDNKFAVYWCPPQKARYAIIGITVSRNESLKTDLLNPLTTKLLLEATYEEYFHKYQGDFGSIIKGAFFDEPSPGCEMYPWNKAFPDEFQKEHGYDILENLAHLAWDISDKTPVVRHHFRQTQHRLQSLSYLNQMHEWCRKREILFTGHLTRTEWLSLAAAWWPNELRCYKYMDIPCCDPLGKAYGWEDTKSYHTGIKVASSAAHIFEKKQAGSDCLAVIGDEVCLRDLKGMLDYQIALGINFFVVHGFSYSIEGPRKDEAPPSLFYQHSEWEYMGELTDYIKNVCDKLTGGEHICKILMLYPSTSLACQQKPSEGERDLKDDSWRNLEDERKVHELVETMLSSHKDFDFIDEITLDEVIGADGRLSLNEPYEMIVLPYIKYISEDAAAALARFASANGKVICVGSTPSIISKELNDVRTTLKGMCHIDGLNKENISALLPEIVKVHGNGANDVFVNSYRKDGEICIFAYNRSENIFTGEINGTKVALYGKTGKLIDQEAEIETPMDKLNPIETLNTDWDVTFENNQIPLNFWHFFSSDEMDKADYAQNRTFDLMNREKGGSDPGMYRCRFMCSGKIANMKIVMEEGSVEGEWELFVNGKKIEKWNNKTVFDCKNIEAEINDCLKYANAPVINTVDIVIYSEKGRLLEMPYLYGNFACQYPHGHKSFPVLSATDYTLNMDILANWATLGYPAYSGSATYSKSIDVAEDGLYMIDLGRVEDIAEIIIDDEQKSILAWPPYSHVLKLSKGKRNITVKVTNGPGNRFRFAGLPAGLLGPVKLYNVEKK